MVQANFIQDHILRYPEVRAEDIYKFIHQSVFGPAHMVRSRKQVEECLLKELDREWEAPYPENLLEHLVDMPGEDPSLARLNLRPFREGSGDRRKLVDVFIETAKVVVGERYQMKLRLDFTVQLLRRIGREELSQGVLKIKREMGSRDFPVVHHSRAFREIYRPSYRVICVNIAKISGIF